MKRALDGELIVLDEATVWLHVRELVSRLAEQLHTARDAEHKRELVHDMARTLRLEISILEGREAIAFRAFLLALEVGCGEDGQ